MSNGHTPAYTESLLSFGRGEHLVGVLTRAGGSGGARVASAGADSRLGVLLLNAGVIARSGPHRFNVKLARALAALRLPVLRFDISGLGDSGVCEQALPHAKQVTDDIARAIDVLQSEADIDQVLIVGICSGANQGWMAALTDHRIAALVMIDPHAYPTRKTLTKYHLRRLRLRSLSENMSLLLRGVRSSPMVLLQLVTQRGRRGPLTKGGDNSKDGWMPPSLIDYVQGMQRLVDRGVNLLLIYTGTWSRHYSYPEQFDDRFGPYPFSAQIQCEYVPQYDHTLTLVAMQQRMIRRIESWIESILNQRHRASVDSSPVPSRQQNETSTSLADGK